jgi:hypothetical protein
MSDFEIKAGYVPYDINMITYDRNGFVTTNCNSISFINYGTSNVTIDNNVVLTQGQQLNIDGNAGEIINRQFLVNFSGTGTVNNLVTVKKNYI